LRLLDDCVPAEDGYDAFTPHRDGSPDREERPGERPGRLLRETVRRITEKGSGESPERLLVEKVRWIEREAFG